MRRNDLLAIIFIIFVSLCIFWQFFIQQLYPYPGNFMLAWFEPWKTEFSHNGVITLAHKPIADDIFKQLYPFRTLAMDMLKTFQLPLWNPYNGAGMPLLATMNIGFLDPLNLLYFFLSNKLAWTVAILLQPILIGFASFLYLRKINLSALSAIFGSTVFLFSGVVIVRLIYGIFGLAYAMLPFLLYLFESYAEKRKTKKIFLFPIAIFFVIVSTQPQIALYILLFVFFYMLYRSFQMKLSKTNYFFLGSLWIVGLGLSALQLLPTLELMQHANITRAASQFIFDRFLLAPYHFVTLLVPNYFGNIGTYNFWEPKVDYVETITYMGMIPIFFAIFGLYSKSHKSINLPHFLLAVIIICFITTIRWSLSEALFKLPIPIISTGIPTRIFLLSTFAISILAAYGFEYLFKNTLSYKSFFKKSIPLLVSLACIITFSVLAIFQQFPCPPERPNCYMVSLRNSALEFAPFIFLFVLFFIYIAKQKSNTYKKSMQAICIAFVVLLGIYNSHKYQPFSLEMSFAPQNPLIDAIHKENGRVFGFDEATIDKNFGTFFRFYDPQYYHPLYIRRYGELVSFANMGVYPPPLLRSDVDIINNATVSAEVHQRRDRLFALLGVDRFIYKRAQAPNVIKPLWENQHWIIAPNNNVLPRAYFVDSVIVAKNDKTVLQTAFSPQFNPKTTALVENHISLQSSSKPLRASAKIISYKENSVTVKTDTNKQALLVLSDNYYPGWNAYVDGKKTHVYRTNYTFRGVVMPPGKHTLLFTYQPSSFLLGSALSGLSLVALLLLLFVIKKKNNI